MLDESKPVDKLCFIVVSDTDAGKLSEQMSSTQLVELLNEFLSVQTEIIIKHKGTLDKYEGDAILAFFGAPVFFENHSEDKFYIKMILPLILLTVNHLLLQIKF